MARKRLPVPLRQTEADGLLAAAARPRDRLAVLCSLYLGVRVAELTALEVPDVDLEARLARVRHGKGDRDRAIPIPRALVEPLRAWIGSRTSGYLLPSPRGGRLSTRAVQLLFKRLAVRAGIPDALKPRKVTPHKARHRYAQQLLQKGATIIEVRDLLGHSSVATTQIYLFADAEGLRAAVDRL